MSSDDNLDKAAELQQILNDSAEERVRRLAGPQWHPDFDGKHCIDCGYDIPEGRLKLFKIRCITCQERIEREARRA